MSNFRILNEMELKEITGGYTAKGKQAEILRAAGIRFWLGKEGQVITTWALVNNPQPLTMGGGGHQPDFSQLGQ